MSLETMLKKLQSTSWLPMPAGHYLTNAEGNEGPLNLAWAILGRSPNITDNLFSDPKKLAVWFFAKHVAAAKVDSGTVRDYLTLLSDEEFGKFVKANPKVFGQYMAMTAWAKVFKG